MRRLSRTEVKTLTEVFIGHGNLVYHRHKIGFVEIYSAILQKLGTNDRF